VKILAIRGAGLASLSEPFEVSLDQGALAHAGVFAIVGPTGAGKSTLLDALFLALFGDTPRLTNQQRVRLPGRRSDGDKAEPLTTRDARGLARGDVSLAFAEVDFLGVDGQRYRARWEVRRKRGEGAFRKPVHALSMVSPIGTGDAQVHRIGGTKTEVLGHVVARLGLDFDQFRRSVVLAQGEIAAFLHAPDRDRAELLERITGTEIYGEISREIHLEAVRQRERSGLLVDQLAASSVMDASERRAAEQSLSTAHLNALQAEQARQTDESELARHQLTLDLARERDDAVAQVTAIDAALEERASDVRQVHTMRAVGQVLPVLRTSLRADEEVTTRRDACRAADQRTNDARLHLPSAQAERDAAQHARGEADAEQTRARASFTDAEQAHAAAQALETRAKETLAHGASLDQQRARAEAEQQVAATDQQAAERAITHWRAQLTRWPALDKVLAHALEPDDTLARAARVERERADLEVRADRASASGATLFAASERAERAVLDARERLDASSSRAARAQRQLEGALFLLEGASYQPEGNGSAASARGMIEGRPSRAYVRAPVASPLLARQPGGVAGLDAIETERGPSVVFEAERSFDLGALMKRCTSARRTAIEAQRRLSLARTQMEQLARAHVRRRAEQARDRIDRARFADELGRLQHELTEATAQGEHADRALEAALRASHAEELRAHLTLGEACEVCGATEHPRLRSDTTAATADTAADTGAAALRLQRDAARSQREVLASRHFALRSAFQLTFATGVEDTSDASHPQQSHAQGIAHLRAQQSEIDLALTAVDDAEREAREAQSRVRDEEAVSAGARESAAQAKSERRAYDADVSERSRKTTALAEEAASLGLAVLDECAEATGQSTQAFLRDAFASRSAATLASARLDLLDAQRERAGVRLLGLGAQIDAHREPMERARQACLRAAEAERSMLAARAFQHLRTEDLQRRDAALARASERRAVVMRAVDDAEAERARAEAALGDATDRAALAGRDLDEQVTRALRSPHWLALDRALDADGSDPRAHLLDVHLLDEARALSRCAPEALAERAAEIDAMEKARDQAAAVRDERERRLASHASSPERLGRPIETFDHASIEARVHALSIALEARRRSEVALRSELSRCEHLLERDAVARAAREEKAHAVSAAQEELAVWEDLLDALGSADGKKLRVHAQRLTLRALVHEASLHLQAIAPRYAIEVVEGGDLAIQVSDRALGGEVRALGALSGGETFLVSLALALALRGLTSEQVRIASLFIDEGFGSLDAQSLDVVLSALDALEATGRQVGIVSHVPEVKERFAARIEVVPQGGGKSVVRVTA